MRRGQPRRLTLVGFHAAGRNPRLPWDMGLELAHGGVEPHMAGIVHDRFQAFLSSALLKPLRHVRPSRFARQRTSK